MKKFRMLDLFSGIGGFHLAAEWCWGDILDVVAHCEIEPFAQKVLKKHWPDVPIIPDIRDLHGKDYRPIDLICGGFPCQPFSVAGKRRSEKDDRFLWPEMLRIIKETGPRWIIVENVTGIISLALDNVLLALESEKYTARAVIIPACAKGAPHRRDRIWIIANSEIVKNQKLQQNAISTDAISDFFTNNSGERIQGSSKRQIPEFPELSWSEDERRFKDARERLNLPKPLICRDDDGFPSRVDRLRALGNAIVPHVAFEIMRAIKLLDEVKIY